jgi:hypothetical protein
MPHQQRTRSFRTTHAAGIPDAESRITHWRSTLRNVAIRFVLRTDGFGAAGFGGVGRGIRYGMQDSKGLPDDVPVADAVEQQRVASEPVPDEEGWAEPADEAPLEAAPSDWQEQLETVELDPELEEFDR